MSFWDDPFESVSDTVSDAFTFSGIEKAVSGFNELERDLEGSVTDAWGDVSGKNAEKAARDAAELERIASLKGEELQKHRFQQTEERLSPWMESESEALAAYRGEMGLGPDTGGSSAYMETPGYQAMIDESLRSVEQTAASGGSTAYGGRRLKEAGKVGAGVQQNYYTNYMNMLSEMASPDTSTNVSSLGLGQAATMRAQGSSDAARQGQYLQSEQAAGAAGTGRMIEIGKAFI